MGIQKSETKQFFHSTRLLMGSRYFSGILKKQTPLPKFRKKVRKIPIMFVNLVNEFVKLF